MVLGAGSWLGLRQPHTAPVNVCVCNRRDHHIQTKTPRKTQHQPQPHIRPTYVAKAQYAEAAYVSQGLSKKDKNLYKKSQVTYFIMNNQLIQPSWQHSAPSQHRKKTERINQYKKFTKILYYASTHPYAIITHHTSDMILAGHSKASHPTETKARSREEGKLFMSNKTELPTNNWAVVTIRKIIKAVMSSAAEAELGALFIKCKEKNPARQSL